MIRDDLRAASMDEVLEGVRLCVDAGDVGNLALAATELVRRAQVRAAEIGNGPNPVVDAVHRAYVERVKHLQ